MARGCVLIALLCSAACVAQVLADDPTIWEFQLKESHVTQILVSWNTSMDAMDVEQFSVTHQKKSSQAMTNSGPLSNSSQEYFVTDLVANSIYNVCLSFQLVDNQFCEDNSHLCEKCVDMFTIPVIRDDSLIAVIVCLGIILMLILIGFLCWHYAKKQKEGEEEDDEGSENGSDESKQPILLSVPAGNGPRRSVDFEDRDIPYITPPLEETNKGASMV